MNLGPRGRSFAFPFAVRQVFGAKDARRDKCSVRCGHDACRDKRSVLYGDGQNSLPSRHGADRGPRQKAYKIRLVLTSTDCALDPSPSCKLCNRVRKTRRVSNTLDATTFSTRSRHACSMVMHWNAMPRPPIVAHCSGTKIYFILCYELVFSALSVAVPQRMRADPLPL